MKNPIPVFYDDKQVFDACSYSKSPLKPALLARRIALDEAFEIQGGFAPISVDELKLTHDPAHIDALMVGAKANGFGNRSIKEMNAIRYTAGNLLAAARHPGDVAWSLTSGFHHAHADECGGFCTIEALTLVAELMHEEGCIRTLIVDEDAHFPDGCVAQIERNRMHEYCRIIQSRHTHGSNRLDLFERQVLSNLEDFNPGLVIYQSGGDNWVCDPLGGSLTIQEMYLRDLIVFQATKERGIPIVVNLAGGYADDYEHTLRIHMNTGEAMKAIYLGVEPKPIYPVSAIELEGLYARRN